MFEGVEEGRPDNGDSQKQDFHYYYDHDKRIESAPQIVQEFYAGKHKPVKGIRIFFTKQNRYIFFALVIFVAAAFIYNGMNRSRNYAKVNELDCEINAFVFEDQVYTSLNIKRNVKSKKSAPQNVTAEFFLINGDKQIVSKETQNLIYVDGEQSLRTRHIDFEIARVDVIVNVDGVEKEISTVVKR